MVNGMGWEGRRGTAVMAALNNTRLLAKIENCVVATFSNHSGNNGMCDSLNCDLSRAKSQDHHEFFPIHLGNLWASARNVVYNSSVDGVTG